MASREIVMQEIFSKLSEQNQDLMILIAKGANIAQENPKRKRQDNSLNKSQEVSGTVLSAN